MIGSHIYSFSWAMATFRRNPESVALRIGLCRNRSTKVPSIETSEFFQPRSECRRQRLECRICRRFRAEIEGTDIQAVVASEDVVSHTCGEVVGYFFASASKLDRQIGNAASRIDDVGLSDGLSGAGLNAQ